MVLLIAMLKLVTFPHEIPEPPYADSHHHTMSLKAITKVILMFNLQSPYGTGRLRLDMCLSVTYPTPPTAALNRGRQIYVLLSARDVSGGR